MTFHSFWIRGDRVRTSSWFVPPTFKGRLSTWRVPVWQVKKGDCMSSPRSGQGGQWERARFGSSCRAMSCCEQRWLWAAGEVLELRLSLAALGREALGGSCQTRVTSVVLLSFTTSHRTAATEFGSFSQCWLSRDSSGWISEVTAITSL